MGDQLSKSGDLGHLESGDEAVEGLALYADGATQNLLAVAPEAHPDMTPVGVVADGLDQARVAQLMHKERDARLRTVERAGQRALSCAGRTTGRDHQEEVVALLGETESHQGPSHDGLRVCKGAPQLGDQLDVGERIPCAPHTLGGHALNVHRRGIACGDSRPTALAR